MARLLLLTFLALTPAVAFLAGCVSSSPERTVYDFIRARMEGREERAAELTLEGDMSGFLGGEVNLAGSEVSLSTEVLELKEDRAVVTARFSWTEEELEIHYVCRRSGSRWKVALRETEELWYPDIQYPKEGGTDPGRP